MPQCAGIKRDGKRCTALVSAPQQHCYQHDPSKAEQRRRAASKAGKSKPSRELVNIRQRVTELAEEVLAGRADKGDAAIAGQLYNVAIRAVSVELRAREQQELVERLERLEAMEAGDPKGGSAWGS